MTIEDDMRLVSTVELIAIRERLHNTLAPFDGPVTSEDLEKLQQAGHNFKKWYEFWDTMFSIKYEEKGLS
jgi:hypothetical protein